ncbi:hypothetical protein [Dinghuibacter silviterrae]|uniref:Aspartyl protease n=1 Tax=Dinghuibacter silviterrae TaxID=1539049 RepID=A0A4R8DY10_9BACT|nr:hypothetical protein [Dinghuibacter silviterrae]TDX02337.1 hypothetical protein EDB95_3395 [Dinghuibacter silviterrae]
MLHTAESGLTLTEETTARLHDLRFTGTVSGVKSWGGNANNARYGKGSLQIGGLRWDSLTVWEDQRSGHFTDGKFGLDLFAHWVVDVDFARRVIVLRKHLPDTSGFQKLPLSGTGSEHFVNLGCDTLTHPFLIHSGYSGALLLDDAFVAAHGLDRTLQVVGEKELKDSFGHVLKVRTAVLPVLHIGTDTLRDVPVGFFQGVIGTQRISLLGGDILRRFHLLFDADRRYLWITRTS